MSDSDAICLTLTASRCGCVLWREWVAPEQREALEARMRYAQEHWSGCPKQLLGPAPCARTGLYIDDQGHFTDFGRTVSRKPAGTIEIPLPPSDPPMPDPAREIDRLQHDRLAYSGQHPWRPDDE